MGTFGGKQPGAGRPRKEDKFRTPIAAAENRISDKLPFLIDKAFELADGVTCAELTKDGGYNVYTRPPDIQTIKYLVDRIMSKPTERVEQHTTGEYRIVIVDAWRERPPAEIEIQANDTKALK